MEPLIVVYGSYGYTGQLIVEECKRKNLNLVLSGRDALKLQKQSNESGYPFEVVDLNDYNSILKLLAGSFLLIHCGGPFKHTAETMVKACLDTDTHYTDITGEFEVFELLATYDSRAKEKGIMIMPGTGFDVVPSDCLALYLKNKLPNATHLQLAFTSSGGFSRGTSKTMIEGLGYGSAVRKGGKITRIKTAEKVTNVNFGSFESNAVCIPWGDIATAYRSTGIQNIEVYAAVNDKTLKRLRLSNYFNWLLRKQWVKNMLKETVDTKSPGPSKEKRDQSKSYLWGKVWNGQQQSAEARIETLSGYALTAKTSVLIAEKILQGEFKAGYQTPAMMYGSELILEIEGSKRK
jgi:short subunit dehydrogenase-like uncharacterized protein